MYVTDKFGCSKYFDTRKNDLNFHDLNIFFKKNNYHIGAKIKIKN